MKEKLINFLKENIEVKLDYESLIEKPKVESHGDYALPMFLLAKELKKNPQDIAKDYENKLSPVKPEFLEKIKAVGPFLNFYIDTKQESKDILESFFSNKIFEFENNNPLKILIEYPSPNTNKSLHVGHVRNILIGNSLCKILKKVGHTIIKTNINNDRGIAICKSMLGYELFFKDSTPKSLNLKSDEFVSKCYVKFEKEAKLNNELNKKAQEVLLKWEQNDEKTILLWKKIINWVFEGYKITYNNYKLNNFDREYFESEIYKNGRDIVMNAYDNKVSGFKKEKDGAIFCDLEDVGLDKKYLLRPDGTTLYITQDLYLTKLKENEFEFNKSIFIVGKDQEYHFKVLFEILKRIGLSNDEKNYHFAYGYVYNKDGKKFASRKGEIIGADWMYNLALEKSRDNLLSKEKTKQLNNSELEKKAKIIGYSALCFSILKSNPYDDIKFDIDKASKMTGETGPYIQYTYARIMSVLKKSKFNINVDLEKLNLNSINDKEKSLLKILKEYNDVVITASNKYKISLIANYLIKVCKNFNDFYQNYNILNSSDDLKEFRLVLSYCTSKILKDGLELLDIEVLEEM
ncbi:MAG: arginine--tRNA ligase [Nanoarchaeota archaeon]